MISQSSPKDCANAIHGMRVVPFVWIRPNHPSVHKKPRSRGNSRIRIQPPQDVGPEGGLTNLLTHSLVVRSSMMAFGTHPNITNYLMENSITLSILNLLLHLEGIFLQERSDSIESASRSFDIGSGPHSNVGSVFIHLPNGDSDPIIPFRSPNIIIAHIIADEVVNAHSRPHFIRVGSTGGPFRLVVFRNLQGKQKGEDQQFVKVQLRPPFSCAQQLTVSIEVSPICRFR